MSVLGFRWLPIKVVAQAAVFLQQPMHGNALVATIAEIPVQGAQYQCLAVGQFPDFVIGTLGFGGAHRKQQEEQHWC